MQSSLLDKLNADEPLKPFVGEQAPEVRIATSLDTVVLLHCYALLQLGKGSLDVAHPRMCRSKRINDMISSRFKLQGPLKTGNGLENLATVQLKNPTIV